MSAPEPRRDNTITDIQQRAALQRQIWQIANEVRGLVGGRDFRQYVPGTLFYRFISENFAVHIEGGDDSIIGDIRDDAVKIYDPACGSGSLLLQARKYFDAHIIEDGFFGQEINRTTCNLARMNMLLRGNLWAASGLLSLKRRVCIPTRERGNEEMGR